MADGTQDDSVLPRFKESRCMYDFIRSTLLIGIGATALMDIWALGLKAALAIPLANWALVGRWFWHLGSGKVFHDDIGKARPYAHELALGWFAHYAIGVFYAGILILAVPDWTAAPSFLPAWILGIVTIGAGWFLLQPGMGAGWAASKRSNANQIRLLNFLGHTVFAIGLYGMALLIR
jgi:hypothetical protein